MTVMAKRWGLGPVFFFEWLMTSRRWQMYAGRALFVGSLLGAMVIVWLANEDRYYYNMTVQQRMSRMGVYFFYALTCTQLALVMLAAPAATAGSICLDKARGTLTHSRSPSPSSSPPIPAPLAAPLVSAPPLRACALPALAARALPAAVAPCAGRGPSVAPAVPAFSGCSLPLMETPLFFPPVFS